MKRVDFIEILYSFLCLEKHRNFQSAAEELNVSKSTLSRRMTMLEKELGEVIFIRDSTPNRIDRTWNKVPKGRFAH